MLVRKSDCVELEMSVDAALKYIVSMGVVVAGRLPLPGRRTIHNPITSASPEAQEDNAMAMRSEYCGLVTEALMGETVTLCGWVNRRRDHGGVIFIDLRDREGYVQVVCDPDRPEMFKVAEDIRNEFCVQVKGIVRARPAGTTNDKLKSGQIEVLCHELNVLNAAVTPPFQVDDDNLSENVRLTNRVMDLRRPVDAAQPDAALQNGYPGAQLPGQAGLHRHRNPHAGQVHARRRARLPGAFARA